MAESNTRLGPERRGERLSLGAFWLMEFHEGWRYELGRGRLVVSPRPTRHHAAQVEAIRRQFAGYAASHPGSIYPMPPERWRVIVGDLESQRYPDFVAFREPPVEWRDTWAEDDGWGDCVPELIVEVASTESAFRDYIEKPEEYLRFGAKEYWVVDERKDQMLVHRRCAGQWKIRKVRSTAVYRPGTFPGMVFLLAPVFDAAKNASR